MAGYTNLSSNTEDEKITSLKLKICRKRSNSTSMAEFIDPDWGDKVNSGIGLSYRPARPHGLAGQYENPLLESTLSPSQGSMNSAT